MDTSVPQPVNELMQALVNLVGYLVAVILPLLIPRIVAGVKSALEDIKRQQPEWLQKLIEDSVRFGTGFAEMIDLDGRLEEYGRDKKELALRAAKDWLRHQGYEIDDSLLDAAIETHLFHNPQQYPHKPRG